ncbi:MAG TPA: hypothetical protein VJV03_04085 [Pyrinomonadaceae bacterium]|nr:hypothetical protein [Pyrinomonadaceae bacterium]
MNKIFIVLVILTFWTTTTSIRAATVQSSPCSVRTIYVADLGSDPRHINFRLFLEKWLSKKKFTAVTRHDDADAVLSGTLSISSGRKYSYLTFKGAELKTPSGQNHWRGEFDFKTKNAFGWLGRGHIENGAKRIAENLRASCK